MVSRLHWYAKWGPGTVVYLGKVSSDALSTWGRSLCGALYSVEVK